MQKKTFLPVKEQLKIFKRGVIDLYVESELIKKLEKSYNKNKPLIIKAGFDPTAPDLHIGHMILLNKLKEIQNLGHKIIFLIGDFTARIGDPSQRNKMRPCLSDNQISQNVFSYKSQVFKVLNSKKTVIKFNNDWYSQYKMSDFIDILSKCSLAQIIERDDFKKRLQNNYPIGIHELLYPIMQGYDSVMLKADVELGGSDQLFNLLVGRMIMKQCGTSPQCILTVPLLEGVDSIFKNGKIIGKKMSKSYKNYITFHETSENQFGKIMSICDALMWRYYRILFGKNDSSIKKLQKMHPKEAKSRLGLKIATIFHGQEKAERALKNFNLLYSHKNKNFKNKDAPMFTVLMREDKKIVSLLVKYKLCFSRSVVKRLISQGAIFVNGVRVLDNQFCLIEEKNFIKIGKKKWAIMIIV